MDTQTTILALDSSTEACSVALLMGNEAVEKFEVIGRGHAEHLLPMIKNLLQENAVRLEQIDLFAYGAGPGSFTGLRIGAAMMQGLALAGEKKIVPVSSLAALAAGQLKQEQSEGQVLSLIDARMDQVYHGLYQSQNQHGLPLLSGEVAVTAADDIRLPEQGRFILCGTGWDKYKELFQQMQTADREIKGMDTVFPHAADIARIAQYEAQQGHACEAEDALPHYVRDKVARTMAEQR